MKKTIISTIPMIILAAACSKQPAAEEEKAIERIPESITVKATSERFWRNTDALSVFDTDFNRVNLSTSNDNVPSALFNTSAWTGKAPLYASYSCEKNNNSCTAEGIFNLVIRDRQSFKYKDDSSKDGEAAVGIVTGSPGSYEARMKNISAFIRASLNSPIIAKIAVTAIGGETLCGYVDVDINKILAEEKDFWTPTEGKSTSSVITAVPASGNCFEVGDYLIALLPGKYSQGLRLAFLNDEDSEILVITLGDENGLELTRNEEALAEVEIDTTEDVGGVTHEGVTPGEGTDYDE